jgi:ATP-binding cassette subfamily B protein
MSLSPRGRLRRSLGYLRPFRGAVIAILGLVLVMGALNALEPLILKSIFDELGGGRR